jgi:8-oxo-dGTP pyrophosphatase MutT (NUDIX family)/heme-degrading monooxygenase HmoA
VTFARPQPPYYAVIITSSLSGQDPEGYAKMSDRMAELGEAQPGYLGRESMTDGEGNDLTVIYYRDAESISRWKEVPAHLGAQKLGRERWYSQYQIEVSKVERHYRFDSEPQYVRRSARVILVDDQQRVLLFHAHKDIRDHSKGTLWFTPGGGVDEGEELHVAAARELLEETGLTVKPEDLQPMVAYSEGLADFPGWVSGQMRDSYFFLRIGRLEIDKSGHTDFESQQLFDSRWWTLEELRTTTEEIVPKPLADLVEQFCAEKIPSEPLVIPWHH